MRLLILFSVLLITSLCPGQEAAFGLQLNELESDSQEETFPTCWGELRFVSADIATGEVEVLSDVLPGGACFQQGVSDYDPFDKRYFYMADTALIVIDGFTGAIVGSHTVTDPTLGSNEEFINIAYNWLDGQVYGFLQDFVQQGDGDYDFELTPMKVDPVSGQVTLLSEASISTGGTLFGNCDIDVFNRVYTLVGRDEILRYDIDTGELLSLVEIEYPASADIDDYLTHVAYDWTTSTWYGMVVYFSFDNDGEAYFVRFDEEGVMTMLTDEPIDYALYLTSNSDIDPLNDDYHFIADDVLYTFSLSSGDLLTAQALSTTSDALDPLMNLCLDFLHTPPVAPVTIDLGVIEMPASGALAMDMDLGPDLTFDWGGGNHSSAATITSAGSYNLSIQKQGVLFDVQFEVTEPTSLREDDMSFEIIHDRELAELRISTSVQENVLRSMQIVEMSGKAVRRLDGLSARQSEVTRVDLSGLAPAVYLLILSTDTRASVSRFVVD